MKRKPCHYCEKPIRSDAKVVQIYLAHGNGGAYGVAPAHAKCHKATRCPNCGDPAPKRNPYGSCEECGATHYGVVL